MKCKISFLLMLFFLFPLGQLFCQNSPGDMWFVPDTLTVQFDNGFSTEIHVNTGTQILSALGIDIIFDPAVIDYETVTGLVQPPNDYMHVDIPFEEPGLLRITGFTAEGMGPGEDLPILTIDWRTIAPGTSSVSIIIDSLAADTYETIGTPNGIPGTVIVSDVAIGDVDYNGVVDILDALIVARYYVGLYNKPIYEPAADVDRNGVVDIVDALQIARYYVGLIDSF